uniref:Putative serine/threonine protein kinase n=1 Tax=Pithovirus LCPAC302 TaxID=2506593 RepID=A0A481Z6G5_9VIRU|nr:MAG: putative serine/threonine protein kinase [Pithovirus LCPAC302]
MEFKWYLSDFKLIKKIGKGAGGDVYLSKHKNNEICALKIIDPKVDDYGMKLSTKIKHNNFVRCYDIFTDFYKFESRKFLVMEYIKGKDIFDILVERGAKHIKYILPDILHQIIVGLKYLHSKGLIHRDIKPENIMLDQNGIIKIVDFDFLTDDQFECRKCGTPHYISPEILKKEIISGKTDLWSLGVTLHLLLTKEYPFDGEDYNELFYNIINLEPDLSIIPNKYYAIVHGLLQKNPKVRISLKKISEILKTF